MEKVKSGKHIRALTEASVLVAIAFALSYVRLQFAWLQGGSITPASMLFILVIGIRRGPAWGLGGALIFACLKMMQGFYPPPTETLTYFILVVVLDYVLAFGVLGLSGFFSRIKNGFYFALPICIMLRFLCHFIAGIIIWSVYAPDGTPVWIYSLTYNGSYIGVELVICIIAAIAIAGYNKTIFTRKD